MPTDQNVRRPFVLASVMAAMFMIAIEATIVSTAMPRIAGQLGDLHLYAWVFSAFLLTQTATTVVFGKLADLFGRRPVIIAGIVVFLVGSILCGLAWSMPSMIAFRLIQGTGAGAIQPVCLTVVGDLYPGQARGKIQGYLASVWGISSVLGPLAGGLITQHLSWAWIFWINVPVGLAASAGFFFHLRESVARETKSVDFVGAGLFAASVAALMVALTELGTANDATALAAIGLCAISAILFVLQERRARDPMIVFALWAHRPIATANAATLCSGVALTGLTSFLPMYVQGVLGRSPLVAGFTLTMMVLGWPIAATLAARHFPRFGLRRTFLVGAVLLPAGALVFPILGPASSPVLAGLGSLVMGFGMGFMSTAAIVIIQGCVGWAERGAATASNVFSRNLGSTLGAAVLGGVLNIGLAHQGGASGPVDFSAIRQLLEGGASAIGDAAIRLALGQSLHLTFWAMFFVTILTLLFAALVPSVAPTRGAEKLATEEV
jgi:EmrB/QacA subfamily drug resistance transporter